MKKRMTLLLLGAILLAVALFLSVVLLAVGIRTPEQLLPALKLGLVCAAWVLPAAVLGAVLLARAETKRLTKALNGMDLSCPEAASLDRELSPLVGKLQKQNDVIAAQLKQIREESANRESQRREFTANVSHELKTPLTTISGTAEILRSGMVRPEDVAHFADNIYRESQRMTSLVSDILRLSQLEEAVQPIRKEPVDLYAATQEVLSWLQEAAAAKGVTLSLTGTRAVVSGSEKILSDMIYNLCDNAIKYNRDGGWVKVTVRESGGRVRLTVTDTGIGIPKEHHERIFERFYRVDKSHSREIGGTGLGLSIVKHGAIFHGAEVNLRSHPGTGTVVAIEFPDPNNAQHSAP